MSRSAQLRLATSYPRITLHCTQCGNEFNVNVLRFHERRPVDCQICGLDFPEELGYAFSKALYEMFTVKHRLEEEGVPFELSFVYKSTFKQPPAPYPFELEDFQPEDFDE